MSPQLMENPLTRDAFPADAVDRAKTYLGMLSGGSVGAYTDSRGIPGVREEVCAFIRRRDGEACPPIPIEDVNLTNGASEAVCRTLTALLRNPSDGVLVPIPQYPLYSASIDLHNGTLLPYYLDEDNGNPANRFSMQTSKTEHVCTSRPVHTKLEGGFILNECLFTLEP